MIRFPGNALRSPANRAPLARAARSEPLPGRGTGRAVLLTIAVLGAASAARAEPYLAIRTGLGCASCHVNRTGGGARTAYGAGYGAQTLPWRKLRDSGPLFDGQLSERVRLGADFRYAYFGTLQDPGAFVGENRISGANVYLAVDLIPDRITLYADERIAPGGAQNREAFALLRTGRAGMYVKAGRFFLPYGLRLQDDDAATRRFTGFNFNSQDTGIEFGAEAAGWSTAIAVTNGAAGGSETDNGKQVSWIGSYGRSRWRGGLSASHNDLPADRARSLGGAFGGLRAGPVELLAEWDLIRNRGEGVEVRAAARHVELDWKVAKGFNVRAWTGRYDPDRAARADALDQHGVGVDWTVLPGLQVRAAYRAKHGPAAATAARDDEALVEIHLYF